MSKKKIKLVNKYLDDDASKKMKAIEDERRPLVWYAAGRIEMSRNRYGVVECARSEDQADFPELVYGDGFIYSGPFTISCDHGCAHEPASRPRLGRWTPQGTLPCDMEIYQEARGTCSHGSFPTMCIGSNATANRTFSRALRGIDAADCVFVWLNSEECFGTLVEIGYARGLNKKIYLAHPVHIDPRGEMWFAFEAATFVMQTEDPQFAWLQAIACENEARP